MSETQAQPAQPQPAADLQAQAGELRMTIEITRAATGEVETYDLVGHIGASQEQQQ